VEPDHLTLEIQYHHFLLFQLILTPDSVDTDQKMENEKEAWNKPLRLEFGSMVLKQYTNLQHGFFLLVLQLMPGVFFLYRHRHLQSHVLFRFSMIILQSILTINL